MDSSSDRSEFDNDGRLLCGRTFGSCDSEKLDMKLQAVLYESEKVDLETLNKACEQLSAKSYQEVVEERGSALLRCGFPLCDKSLNPRHTQSRFRIAHRRLCDSTESGLYCSDSCHRESNALSRRFFKKADELLDGRTAVDTATPTLEAADNSTRKDARILQDYLNSKALWKNYRQLNRELESLRVSVANVNIVERQ